MKIKACIALILALLCPALALAETAAPMAVSEEAAMQLYAPVLDTYRAAVTEGWDMEKIDEHDLSYVLAYLGDMGETLGYRLMDIDQDGAPELLIGLAADREGLRENILGLYTLVDYAPKQVCKGWERNSYDLLDDMTILNHGSNSAFSGGTILWKLENGQLVALDAVIHDYEKDENNPYFRTDGSWEAADGEPISNEEAEGLLSQWESRYMAIGYLPLIEE